MSMVPGAMCMVPGICAMCIVSGRCAMRVVPAAMCIVSGKCAMCNVPCAICSVSCRCAMCMVPGIKIKKKNTPPYSYTLVVKVLAKAGQSERWVDGVSVLVGMKSRTSPLVSMSMGVDV